MFASWNFYIEENSYVNIHVNSVVQILRLCREMETSFLFISTFLANSASKSRYNKAKYLCEVECNNYSQSWIRLGVLLSDTGWMCCVIVREFAEAIQADG